MRVEVREGGEVDQVQQAAAYETDGVKARGSRSQSGQAQQIEANRKRQKECKPADYTGGFGVLYL